MKKFLTVIIFLSAFSFASAQSCTDIQKNLYRGVNSNAVLMLQNFLYAKGFLKATPNGYFGNATLSAVKAYQKSIGLSQVGNTGPATRAAIKKDSCEVSILSISTPSNSSVTSTKTPTASSTSQNIQQIQTVPTPKISSIELATFFQDGYMDAPLVINGSNFADVDNEVILKLQSSNRRYSLGLFASASGTVISINSDFTTKTFPCGTGCTEKIPSGKYEVSVKNKGGESNTGYISISGFKVSSITGSSNYSILQKSVQALLGTVVFSSPTAVSLEDINISISDPSGKAKITNLSLKDELLGTKVSGSGVFNLNHIYFPENQSKIYGIYGDVDSPVSSSILIDGFINVKDYIGKNIIKFNIPEILTTISG